MFVNYFKLKFNNQLIFFVFVLIIFMNICNLFPQNNPIEQNNCLTQIQIIDLLRKKVSQDLIIKTIKRYGIDFNLCPEWKIAANLAREGATDSLLETINNNYCRLIIDIFSTWIPFGGVQITPENDGNYFMVNGNLIGFSGYTTTDAFEINNRRVLKIKVEGSDNSTFSIQRRMLKIIAGTNQRALLCSSIRDRSQDPEFISQKDGTFEYLLPGNIVDNGTMRGLGVVFGPGVINNLKISAWFQ